MALVARSRWILALVLVGLIAGVWWSRRQPALYSVAYVAVHGATLWDTTAQVREPLATLSFGDRLMVMRHSGNQAEVRTNSGTQGWLDERLLMDAALWGKRAELLTRAGAMPVQASGHTRTISNVHIEPGRDAARIFQFGRDVPVVVLERSVLPAPAEGAQSSGGAEPKMEDWLLVLHVQPAEGETAATRNASPVSKAGSTVLGTEGADIPVAGWVLGRFVALDPPQLISDYASSAAMRVVAWAVLDKVPSADGDKPQFLVAGTRGAEGQPCDFTLLRVYTWSSSRQRYETAYIESDLCGRLPIRVAEAPGGAEFRFADFGPNGAERIYRMRGTIVRQVRERAAMPARRH